MHVVLDTNILVSALFSKNTPPDLIYQAWQEGRFQLLTSEDQLEELTRVLSYPKLQKYIKLSEASLLITGLRIKAQLITDLPSVNYSPDPDDNKILAIAIKAEAPYLVTGDKADLLSLTKVQDVEIVTARVFLNILNS